MPTRSSRVVVGNSIYRQALTPQQKEQKKDYLLQQQLHSQPTWDEIWEEIKAREAEWGRYIKQEAARLHPRYEEYPIGTQGLTVPRVTLSDEMVEAQMEKDDPKLWGRIQSWREQGKDKEAKFYYNRLWVPAHVRLEREQKAELEALMGDAEDVVKAEAYTEFKKLQDYIKRLEGNDCWRALMVPRETDLNTLGQLGVFWSVDYEAAQPYSANRPGLWDTMKTLVVRGRIDPTYIDWKGTAGARFIEVYGDMEGEVRFFKHSPIYAHDIQVFSDPNNWYKTREPNEVIPIKDYLRC